MSKETVKWRLQDGEYIEFEVPELTMDFFFQLIEDTGKAVYYKGEYVGHIINIDFLKEQYIP